MLADAIAYQVLQQENPQTIDKVKAALTKRKILYVNQWSASSKKSNVRSERGVTATMTVFA